MANDGPENGSGEIDKPAFDTKPAAGGDDGSLANGVDDTIAAGQVDPVYEAKARVLNHAARRDSSRPWQVELPGAFIK